MNILLDADLIIAVALDRQPSTQQACDLLDFLERDRGIAAEAFVAWHSVVQLKERLVPLSSDLTIADLWEELAAFVKIAPVQMRDFRSSLRLPVPLDQQMQAAAALGCEADCLVSCEPRRYTGFPTDVLPPAVVLERLRASHQMHLDLPPSDSADQIVRPPHPEFDLELEIPERA